jgi:Mrp family chromosome partitioning ATPase
VLEERVAETKRDKDDAKRMLDEAEARLKSLENSNASHDVIATASARATAAQATWAAAMETHKAAIEAESRAVESARNPFVGARLVPFSFNPDVRARLERPLSEWQPGETFDVSGIADAVGAEQWHNQLYLRAEGLALLRQWEDDAPYLAVYGTPGVGKSTLLQLAALRALVKGEPVFLRMRDVDKLIRVDDDEQLSVERLTLDDLSHEGRPRTKNTVMCYDSPAGFQKKVGHANHFKKVFIVHNTLGTRPIEHVSQTLCKRRVCCGADVSSLNFGCVSPRSKSAICEYASCVFVELLLFLASNSSASATASGI